eukprot:Blabericola_migrator_1__7994@NODE_40_length_17295_cov_124_751393_g36_i0_p8_GENE_NODE_40_length_17295_cov_124_751393_g36_i0NODE_40_length_17295_cov_124_751393_g36_i0_p8_ORF_typecomplete_len254_score52_25RRM_1/PF00076_22/1_2e16RRM_1/PF00076_22/2e20RRM_5/PF13893_6/5_9e07RRM_5/PF13893_6/4_3e08RRM_7/PF16367_5/0_019RRM_7/PF16367_5/0_00064Nup35_RRM_2/PF14605_6/0_49Nup35_RRM_2/PF14605_6/3_3RRM_8/PF11835_8/0_11RRM_8/PF11835_8/69Limkainb1/PF11608_8/2Limkainb1/PF11608_8/31RL/PF17797_1/23RL/PF17797_1/2_7OB_
MSLLPEISPLYERNQEATLYVGNLDARVDEDLLWELFTQVGIVKNVHIPRDKITGLHQGYGFVEFQLELDAEYAMKVMSQVKLYQKLLRINKAAQDKRQFEVGANLFVGNLDPEVDEKKLYDTFSSFGNLLSTKIMRDPETGQSRGFGFVSYDSFDASDVALYSMNGQFLWNRPVHVSYAYKKDTKGERHGSAAERLIAANRPSDFDTMPAVVPPSVLPPVVAPALVVPHPPPPVPPLVYTTHLNYPPPPPRL